MYKFSYGIFDCAAANKKKCGKKEKNPFSLHILIIMSTSDICEIIAVRHGETVANKTGVLQGQFNTALNEVGLMQSDAIAARLKNRHFDIAYSSDLDRAMITGQKIVAYHPGLELLLSPELREWNLGKLQGREYKDLIVEYPEVMQAFKKGGSPDVPE